MWTIFNKELSSFFSLLIAYIVIGVFILILGLLMWVFPDFSLLYFNYASLDQLFDVAPILFIFIVPALSMRSFSEEIQAGTLESLLTKPITETQIVLGKFCAFLAMTLICLLPSLFYFYSVYQLGSPVGNIDTGAVLGSYVGLFFLASSLVSIGLFSSAISRNQVSSFLIAILISFTFYYGFFYFSKLPIFFGRVDDIVQKFGMDYHYNSISKGFLDTRDVIYFASLSFIFLWLTVYWIKNRFF
ncbi:MAG: ABC transporter permease subunit [Saprospiraceae bacterium]